MTRISTDENEAPGEAKSTSVVMDKRSRVAFVRIYRSAWNRVCIGLLIVTSLGLKACIFVDEALKHLNKSQPSSSPDSERVPSRLEIATNDLEHKKELEPEYAHLYQTCFKEHAPLLTEHDSMHVYEVALYRCVRERKDAEKSYAIRLQPDAALNAPQTPPRNEPNERNSEFIDQFLKNSDAETSASGHEETYLRPSSKFATPQNNSIQSDAVATTPDANESASVRSHEIPLDAINVWQEVFATRSKTLRRNINRPLSPAEKQILEEHDDNARFVFFVGIGLSLERAAELTAHLRRYLDQVAQDRMTGDQGIYVIACMVKAVPVMNSLGEAVIDLEGNFKSLGIPIPRESAEHLLWAFWDGWFWISESTLQKRLGKNLARQAFALIRNVSNVCPDDD